MKKRGFTLAEILITMGIIGIVAALAAPALIAGSSKAKIGPTLGKVVSTFESAAELLLHDEETSSLVSIAGQGTYSGKNLGRALSKYMKIDDVTGQSIGVVGGYKGYDGSINLYPLHPENNYASMFIADDNTLYFISNLDKRSPHGDFQNIENNQVIGDVYVDINGPHKPNTVAKDVFRFVLYNDGTLRPWGSKNAYNRAWARRANYHWNENHSYCNSTHVHNVGWECTGSIFDNNMKVIYK